MGEYDEFEVAAWLRDGITAAKAGQRDKARELLTRVIDAHERNEQAWLWLSGVMDSDEDRLICLQNVLALNPDNVQAQAGIKWLRTRGIGVALPLEQQRVDVMGSAAPPRPETAAEALAIISEDDLFLAPQGCVYCGLPVDEREARCSHCGGRLTTKQFKKEERSPVGYLLHAYWILLAGLNLTDFFLIGFVWKNVENVPEIIRDYLPYVVGSVVIGDAVFDTVVTTSVWVQVVRLALFTLAALGCIVALGLFLRRPAAHTLGIALIALHLILGISLFVLGFLGYLMAAFRALLTVMLTVFMFNTIEDFSMDERRERLDPDRHLRNDADYYSRGRVYEKRGMWAKALLHWQRAAAINPGRDTYYGAMARAYTHLGRYEQALEQVDEAVRVSRNPEEWHALKDIIVAARRQYTNRS